MVQYSNLRDELEWYFDGDTESNENRIVEVSHLLTGKRDDFDNLLERVEKQFPRMNRVQELIGTVSFVDREVREYETDGYANRNVEMAIYRPEGVKSAIIVSRSRGYDRANNPFHLYRVHPTPQPEKKIEEDILWDDYEYERVD